MNILVTGANGQLGNEIRLLAARAAGSQSGMTRFLFTYITDAS